MLVGGTYTPGSDWVQQFFDNSTTMGETSTLAGTFTLESLSNGQCASFGIFYENPCSIGVWIELSGTTQIVVNGVTQEITTSGSVTLDFQAGMNVVHVVVQDSESVHFFGLLVSQSGGSFASLYQLGSDPLVGMGTGGSPSSGGISAGGVPGG